METSVFADPPSGHRPYLGQQALTRPDWPTKHEAGTKARNLLPYILEPYNQKKRVLRVSANSVLIEDKFPKAHVHLLVLPTWLPHRDLHPHDAFQDPEFLNVVRQEVVEGLQFAMPLLRKAMHKSLVKSGMSSHVSQALLDKRDLSKDFHIGVHAHPSQHELHVHIISRDMVSWHEYDAGHYRAFNTPFLVPLQEYPLPLNSQLREVDFQNHNLRKADFHCWRCGKYFERDAYEDLQLHLREEWHSWISEGQDPVTSNGTDLIYKDIQNLKITENDSIKL